MAAKKKKHRKQPGYVFYPMYWCYVLLFIGAIALMMRVLWDNMEDYEGSMPKYVAQEVDQIFLSRDFSTIYDYDDVAICEAEGKQAYIEYMTRLTDGFVMSCREKYSSNPEEKVYQVLFGENKLGTYTLCKSGELTEYGNEKWMLKEIRTNVIESSDYLITVPENSIVYADGQPLDAAFIVESGLNLTDDYLPEGYEFPKWCTYSVARCFRVPEFRVLDSKGREQRALPNSEGRLTVQMNYDDNELRAGVEERIFKVARALSMYTSDDVDRDAIMDYVLPQSKAHTYIRGFDGGWFMPHRDVEFLNMRTDKYMSLDDETFACNVYYDYKVIYRETSELYPTAYTFFFKKDDNGDWMMFDFTTI